MSDLKKFAKQFDNVSKEEVISLLYDALKEDGDRCDMIDEMIDFCECALEDKDGHFKDDIRYIQKNLMESMHYYKENVDN